MNTRSFRLDGGSYFSLRWGRQLMRREIIHSCTLHRHSISHKVFSRVESALQMTRSDTGSRFDLIAEEMEREEDEWMEEMR